MRSSVRSNVRLALLAGAAMIAMPLAAQSTPTAPIVPDPASSEPAAPQSAADTTAQTSRAENPAGTEVIVTAQRRRENVQDVPIAITALTRDQLSATGAADTESLRVAAPSLNVTTAAAGFGLPRIRGIGATGQGPGIENPVAIYVDGVYYGASFGVLQSLYDVDLVTVLKGPQGTLFGRNATGGLIQIQTRDPKLDRVVGSAQLGYGNYDTRSSAGFVSVPLSEVAAVSVSGQIEDRKDGFGRNLFLNRDVQTARSYAARGKFLFQPSSDTKILLSADTNGRDGDDPAFTNYGLNTLGQDVQAQIRARGGDDRYDILADFQPSVRTRQSGVGLTIDQGVGDFTLKSITAYRHSRIRTFFDPDGTTVQTLVINNNQYDKQFSQELNLLSPELGNFKFVGGLYYLHDRAGLDPNRTTGIAIFNNNGRSDTLGEVKLNSYSAFAEGTLKLGSATNLIAGFRYTIDERDFTGFTQTFNGATNATVTSATTTDAISFKRPSWRLSVDHRFSPELMTYASYNRGFRAGTFVPQVAPFTILEPEVVDAYEVGAKTDLFGRRLRLNLAAYYFDQSRVQVFQIISGVQNVYNAQGAEIYGLDGDFSVRVTDNFRLFGGFNYNHARYKAFTDAVISVPFPVASTFSTTQFSYVSSTTGATLVNTTCLGTFVPPNITTQAARDAFYRSRPGGNCLLRGDASGNKLQNTPDVTVSFGGSLDIPTSAGIFTLTGNYYYNDGFVANPDERLRQPHYNLFDAALTWKHPDNQVYARIYGKNLTNAFYRSQLSASNSGDTGYAGAPRTYGVQLGVNF